MSLALKGRAGKLAYAVGAIGDTGFYQIIMMWLLPFLIGKELHAMMKKDGRTTFLEVVSASEKDTVQSTKVALELGVDYLIGGTYIDATLPLIKNKKIKYFPYVGKIVDHPCKLRGSIEEIVNDTKKVKEKGIPGINLLAYRYNGDVDHLIF